MRASAALYVAAIPAAVWLLKAARPVLLPFVLAAFLFYICDPVVRGLAARRVPRWVGIMLVSLCLGGIVSVTAVVASRSVSQIVKDYPRYQPKLDAAWSTVAPRLALKEGPLRDTAFMRDFRRKAERAAPSAFGFLLTLLGEALLVLAYLVFMLGAAPRSRQRWQRAFPARADRIIETIDAVEHRLIRYLWLHLLVSGATSAAVLAILLAYGVQGAFLWAVLNFVGQYAPNIGPIIASVPPIAVALIQDPKQGAFVALWLLAVQIIAGNFFEPKVISHGMKLDPVAVLFGIVFFAWLWGVLGALLAVPILVWAVTICERVDDLRPVARLLRGAEPG